MSEPRASGMNDSRDFDGGRRWSYGLLAQLFDEGPVASASSGGLPELAAALELPENERSAEHYRVLGLEVFPYRSVYLGERPDEPPTAHDALVDAAQSHRIGGEIDHLATQLRLLSVADHTTAERVLPRLVEWLPPFVIALEELGSPLYSAAARVTWGLAVSHAEALRLPPDIPVAAPVDVEAWVADRERSMRDLATFLSRPSTCGVFLSRSAIRAWAASQRVPRGFGPRLTELENGFASAAQYERGPESLRALAESFAGRVSRYSDLAEDEVTGAWVRSWRARAEGTGVLLVRLAEIADAHR